MSDDLIIQINSFLFYWSRLEKVDRQIKSRERVKANKYISNESRENKIIKSLKKEKNRLIFKMAKSIKFAINDLDYVEYTIEEAERYESEFSDIPNTDYISSAEENFSNKNNIDLNYLKFFKWQIDSFYDAMSIYCVKSYGKQIDDIV